MLLATALNNLANLYQATGRYAEAEPPLKRALAIGEKTLPIDHPYQAQLRENYVSLLDALGRREKAAQLRSRVEPASP